MRKLILAVAVMMLGMSVQAQNCKVTKIDRERILIDKSFDKSPDQEAKAFIAPYKKTVDSIMSPVVGHVAEYMYADRPESTLSNLLADILMWASRNYREKPDFSVYNMGGIRAALSAGVVTYGDILSVAPFENKICFLTLTGKETLNLFREIAETGGEGVSHGVELVIKDSTLISARLNGREINPKKNYRIATIDYLAQGNDHLEAFKKKTNYVAPQSKSNDTRFIIMDYFRAMEKKGKVVDCKVEGRITGQTSEPQNLRTSEPVTLEILHSNDSHSCIYPQSENLADTLLAGRGGYLRRLELVKEERAKDPELLLFDSGDFSQGSPYYTLFKGDVEIGLMNMMKYDAAAIGNHEFDYGLENMARLFRMANFPVVCSNYDFTGTVVEGTVVPYTILERKGLKIGIFGLSPELDGLVSKSCYEGVKYLDPVKKANEMTDILRNKEKCNMVICLSHLGWDEGGLRDAELISKSHGIDIVLGGHSHTYMKNLEYVKDADGKEVPVDQNGKHALFVGKINMEVCKAKQ